MFKGKALILDKKDIKEGVGTELSITDLRTNSLKEITLCDIAIATTHSGETIVLKNRSGVEGIVVPLNIYREFQNWLEENNSPIEKPKKKIYFLKKFFIILISWIISGIILIPCLVLSLIDKFERDYHHEFQLFWKNSVLDKL